MPAGKLTEIPHLSSQDRISAGTGAGQPETPHGTPVSITIKVSASLSLSSTGWGYKPQILQIQLEPQLCSSTHSRRRWTLAPPSPNLTSRARISPTNGCRRRLPARCISARKATNMVMNP